MRRQGIERPQRLLACSGHNASGCTDKHGVFTPQNDLARGQSF